MSTTANATTRQPRSSDAARAYQRRISITEEEDIDLPMTAADESPPPSPTPNRPSRRRTTPKEKNSSGSGGGAQPSTFPFKLHEMLEYASSCDSAQMKSACFWSPSGVEFVISDKDVVMEDLAPMFFKQTKFRSFVSSSSVVKTSFSCCIINSLTNSLILLTLLFDSCMQTRQLNLWGFVRTGKIWRHKQSLFHRDRPTLLKQMERTALKSSVDASSAAAIAADRPGGVTVVKPAINAAAAAAATAIQDQDAGVIDTRLDEMHALIPITQQFSTDDLLYLVSMFEEDENMISLM